MRAVGVLLAIIGTATASFFGSASSQAMGFVVPSSLGVRATLGSKTVARSNAIVMACRFNAKKEKRKRNGENARKYRMKNTGPKYLAIKTRKRASKAEYSKRLEQYEMDFTASIYKYEDVDALLAESSPVLEDA